MKNQPSFDIAGMSRLIGQSETTIGLLMGITPHMDGNPPVVLDADADNLKRRIELSEHLYELKALCESCPPGSELQQEALRKWHNASMTKISEIKDVYEMENIFPVLSSKSLLAAMNKGLSVCMHSYETKYLFHFLFVNRQPFIVCNDVFTTGLLEKWLNFSSSELAKAKTFDDRFSVMCWAPNNSNIQIEAANQCLDSVVLDYIFLESLFIEAPQKKELKMAIFDKWLESVGNIEQVKHLYDCFNNNNLAEYHVLSRTEIMAAIYKKIATFFGYEEKKTKKRK